MHRHLCWCLVGAITIVQFIFGALFLGLGCNIFFVLHCQLYRTRLLPQWRIFFMIWMDDMIDGWIEMCFPLKHEKFMEKVMTMVMVMMMTTIGHGRLKCVTVLAVPSRVWDFQSNLFLPPAHTGAADQCSGVVFVRMVRVMLALVVSVFHKTTFFKKEIGHTITCPSRAYITQIQKLFSFGQV